jgi:hypothetical protein
MHFPIPHFPPPQQPEAQEMVQMELRGDVQWNRPIFKAPPLEPLLRGFDAAAIARELRQVGLGAR